jgi:hypothetical protein
MPYEPRNVLVQDRNDKSKKRESLQFKSYLLPPTIIMDPR